MEISRKRKRDEEPELNDKKQKKTLVSCSKVENYLNNDSLADWLDLYWPEKEKNNSLDFLKQKGIEFEKKIVEHIADLFPVKHIGKITSRNCQRVIQEMKNGTEILASVPFVNDKNNTKGIIDLLIRNDIFSKLFPSCSKSDMFKEGKSKFGNYFYVVIDIKFCTLPLSVNGCFLLNSGRFPGYKGQVYLYNKYIADLQEYDPECAFLLGRRYRISDGSLPEDNGINCLEKVGLVDFSDRDRWVLGKTEKALDWIRRLYVEGKSWDVYNTDIKELFPNLKVKTWVKAKKIIAEQTGEITQVWNCGVKQRENAMKEGVKSWRSANSVVLGLRGKRAEIVDTIISVNKGEEVVLPKKIKYDDFPWRQPVKEGFVDFETVYDVFAGFEYLPYQYNTEHIFMIGLYYQEDGQFHYCNFCMETLDREEEYRTMREFCDFVQSKGLEKLYYWSAEKLLWNRALNRHIENKQNIRKIDILQDKLCDLSTIFREEPIAIKGCFGYGLKEISKSLRMHGLIDTEYSGDVEDGLSASISAWSAYKEKQTRKKKQILTEIARYNKTDVVVLQEILYFMRNCM